MEIIILITVNVLAIVTYWIYSTISEANKKEVRLNEAIEKSSKEAIELNNKEVMFHQFKTYVSTIFSEIDKIQKDQLISKLKSDYPFYKNDSSDLFYDLRSAKLIKQIEGTEYFEIGDSFKNLKLLFPSLLEFMSETCEGGEFNFTQETTHKKVVTETEINKIYNINNEVTHFFFGVCPGSLLARKIKLEAQLINSNTSFYLYTKTYSESGTDLKNNNNIQFQDYMILTPQINYQKIFGNWLLMSIPI